VYLFLLGEGLAEPGDREAGRFRGVDDDLFAARQQIHGGRQLLDRLGRDDDGAVPVGIVGDAGMWVKPPQ